MNSSFINKVPDTKINKDGESKYILCEIFDKKEKKMIVRADESAEFHTDILAPLKEDMARIGLEIKCSGDGFGGGRIYVNPKNKVIFLWGKSNALGQAYHETAAKIIKKSFPDFEIITENSDNKFVEEE